MSKPLHDEILRLNYLLAKGEGRRRATIIRLLKAGFATELIREWTGETRAFINIVAYPMGVRVKPSHWKINKAIQGSHDTSRN